jgi:hypothetical protein
MRQLLCCALVLALVPGCKKAMDKMWKDAEVKPEENAKTLKQVLTDQKAPGDKPAVHAPTGVVINPGAPGGSGGAAQAVRKAVVRSVNEQEMHNIRLIIVNAELNSGQMPSKQEVAQALMRESPKTYELVKENAIVVTGTKMREGIWAYTYEAQSATGEHIVLRAGNVERMQGQLLAQALQQQGSR